MNRNVIAIAAIAAAFAGNALAESPLASGTDAFHGQATRAQVQAELAAYRQAGVNPWSTQYNPLRHFKSAAQRDAVVADYIASRDVVNALTAEDSGSAWLHQAAVRNVAPSTVAGQPRNAQ